MDTSKEFQLMLNKAIRTKPLDFQDFDSTKNVQDQLQELVKEDILGEKWPEQMIWQLWKFCEYNGDTWKLKSMEQLWLAFVMSERYSKIWDGTNWLNESN